MGKEMPVVETSDRAKTALRYQLGFASDFATEAWDGALPQGQNGPQKMPFGLYSELISGSAFTAPRALNRRSYLFRTKPSVAQGAFEKIDGRQFLTTPLTIAPYPGPVRWSPFEIVTEPTDFLEGIFTLFGNGAPQSGSGMAVHIYTANRAMTDRAFANADGEMLILPQHGAMRFFTEMGIIEAAPGEVVLIPRGMKFRVDPIGGPIRGFICENYGHPFVLPELGLIGSHGLANTIDFEVPVAAYEQVDGPVEYVQKMTGNFWATQLDHSPFNVVAWRGNWAPCKFDMTKFVVMGTLTVDHPDPSIFCALSSPSQPMSGPNADFMVLPPRWVVAEHTFRPPGFHRNSVAEVLGVIRGEHESRAGNFPPGSISLHNCWTAHGPDVSTYEVAREATLQPMKIEDAIVFMFETRFPLDMSQAAMEVSNRQLDCISNWQGFKTRFPDG